MLAYVHDNKEIHWNTGKYMETHENSRKLGEKREKLTVKSVICITVQVIYDFN